MILIDYTYFQGELYLPNLIRSIGVGHSDNIRQTAGEQNMDWFLDKYEVQFLDCVLGKTLRVNFIDGLREDTVKKIWSDLRNELIISGDKYKYSPIANYVFFYVSRRARTQTPVQGEVKGTQSYATNVDDADKLSKVWNDMCDQVCKIKKFLQQGNYREYSSNDTDYSNFEYINALDI